jgi:UDP-2,3-diacylglucosamine pyrophosphatase LpxH
MSKDIKTTDLDKLKGEIDPDEEILDLRQHVVTLNKRINELKNEYGNVKTIFRDLKEHIIEYPAAPPIYKPSTEGRRVSNPVAVVFHNTDGHMGMVQEASEIEGFGAFSPGLCRARQLFWADQGVEMVELHRANYTINDCHVLVTGDMISGDIHKELTVTNAFPTPVQTAEAGKLLADVIYKLVPHFERVIVDFMVPDNHSRLTDKIQFKEAGQNSLNYLVGFVARTILAGQKNVTFKMHYQYQRVVEVLNRRYLLTHGHAIRSWMGVPYYGIEKKAGKEAMRRMTVKMGGFDRIIMGHYHAPLTHPWFWIGGAVSGTDALDFTQGRHAGPSQALWFVHPKWGEFDRTDFNLSGAE